MDTSISYVSSGTFGWIKEKDPSKGTHVVVSREFYNHLDAQRDEIKRLRDNVSRYESERGQYQPVIDRLKRKIAGLEAEVENIIQDANTSKYSEAEAIKRNETLYLMYKERVNAARGLNKKEHSGYCVLRSRQMERRYDDFLCEMWETTVQTPIAAEWDHEDACRLVMEKLFGGAPEVSTDANKPRYYKCDGLMRRCGITHTSKPREKEWYRAHIFYSGRKESGNPYSEKIPTPEDIDIAYDFFMQQDFQCGLWNLVFSHIHPLRNVPGDMLPTSNVDKKKGSQKAK